MSRTISSSFLPNLLFLLPVYEWPGILGVISSLHSLLPAPPVHPARQNLSPPFLLSLLISLPPLPLLEFNVSILCFDDNLFNDFPDSQVTLSSPCIFIFLKHIRSVTSLTPSHDPLLGRQCSRSLSWQTVVFMVGLAEVLQTDGAHCAWCWGLNPGSFFPLMQLYLQSHWYLCRTHLFSLRGPSCTN